ncbi:thioredoxin family protein [Lacinutrix sp.]|uniref:thioredoxin family protein n=1 Tax=Lacinutrix sp. TaxID=1937692 RepID=UPI0030EE5D71
MSYQDYRTLVKDLVEKESTTSKEKTEALANYTMLNDRRMKRWDKTIKTDETVKENVSNLNINQTWLVLTESWCGDAAHVMPVINKVAELNTNIDFKVVLRDENLDLMNQFLTNGGQSIPKLIMIDNNTNKVINTFGPRPIEATQLVNDYKTKHGKLTPEFKEDLQSWYNKNKGQNVIEDLVGLLN